MTRMNRRRGRPTTSKPTPPAALGLPLAGAGHQSARARPGNRGDAREGAEGETPVSYRALHWAWQIDAPLTPSQRLVLFGLAGYESQHGECHPSVRSLTRRTGLARRTIQAALHDLERLDLIRLRPGSGRTKTSSYLLRKGAAGAPFEAGKGAADAPFTPVDNPEKGAAVAPPPGHHLHERVQQMHKKGAAVAPESGFESGSNQVPLRGDKSPRKVAADWIRKNGWPTGARFVRGTHSGTLVHDPLGLDPIDVNGWPHPRPTFDDVVAALNEPRHD
jgi:hypothetical protein